MANRKDNRGRKLREGESQRKDGRYCFRWTDLLTKKRHTVYALSLNELREKEREILKNDFDGLAYAESQMTLTELAHWYLDRRSNLRRNSISAYQTVIKRLEGRPIGKMPISSIKIYHAEFF